MSEESNRLVELVMKAIQTVRKEADIEIRVAKAANDKRGVAGWEDAQTIMLTLLGNMRTHLIGGHEPLASDIELIRKHLLKGDK